MTPLTKKVRRKTMAEYRVLYSRPRAIIVTLAPGDILEFREAGCRKSFPVAISRAFSYAVRLHAEAERTKRVAERKARKGTK